jgi:predicted site-specific integrase-resolvase
MSFLNPRELAARWRVSPKTLERWRNGGGGPAYLKLQGRILYRLSEVESFEARRTRAASSVTTPAAY